MTERSPIHFDSNFAKNAVYLRLHRQRPTLALVFYYAPIGAPLVAAAILIAVQGAAFATLLRFLRASAQVRCVLFAWFVPLFRQVVLSMSRNSLFFFG